MCIYAGPLAPVIQVWYNCGYMVTKPKTKKEVELTPIQKLTDEQRKEFYKSLVTHSFAEAVIQLGLDAHYAKSSWRSVGKRIFDEIDPSELGLDKDVVEMVTAAISDRKVRGVRIVEEKTGLEEAFTPTELLDPKDNKGVVIAGRNKAAMLLHRKMDHLNKDKKALEAVSLTQITTTFGIMFDKAQIIQGQATENIAVMGKIDNTLSPEASLDMILKMREMEVADKNDN